MMTIINAKLGEESDEDYYLIVTANQNNLRYKVPAELFNSLNLDDEVVIFAIPEKEETFIAKRNSAETF